MMIKIIVFWDTLLVLEYSSNVALETNRVSIRNHRPQQTNNRDEVKISYLNLKTLLFEYLAQWSISACFSLV